MGMAIVLRNRAQNNRFRDTIIAAITADCGDDILLCSGFFQEFFRGCAYQASQEQNFAQLLALHSVSVTTVGIHNNAWMPSYRNFASSLAQAGVALTAYQKTRFCWHAKVFILKKAGRPILGIIGSSNITRRAFSDTEPFNYESDVYLWSVSDPLISVTMKEQLSLIDDPDEVIRAPYDPESNGGLTVPQRLKHLEMEIMSSHHRKLDF